MTYDQIAVEIATTTNSPFAVSPMLYVEALKQLREAMRQRDELLDLASGCLPVLADIAIGGKLVTPKERAKQLRIELMAIVSKCQVRREIGPDDPTEVSDER